jgi:hypothetical protein
LINCTHGKIYDIRRENEYLVVVVSEARYFRNPELNEDNEVYNWPNDFLLYNVLLVRFVDGVAFRMGIGRVSKIEGGLMSPKFEFVRLG